MCLTFVFGALIEFALVNYASRNAQIKQLAAQPQKKGMLPICNMLNTNRVQDVEQNCLETDHMNDLGPTVTFSKVMYHFF